MAFSGCASGPPPVATVISTAARTARNAPTSISRIPSASRTLPTPSPYATPSSAASARCLSHDEPRRHVLTWPGNALAAAGHSLVTAIAGDRAPRPRGAVMRAGDEPPVRSVGTDPAAFSELYRAHVGEVTRFVARRVADPHLAADLTAEVFLAAIDAAERYRGSSGGPRTWLFGIARHVIAAEFRRSARERRVESQIAGRRLLDADDIDRLM